MKNVAFILIFVMILILSCSEGNIISDFDIEFPEKDVSYLYHVQPFLRANCAYSGCHGYNAAGNINMADYFTMMNVPGLVLPGNPNGSQLNQVLEGVQPHPFDIYRGEITQNQIDGMRTWVKEGAQNN
jgi:hypothetical protein